MLAVAAIGIAGAAGGASAQGGSGGTITGRVTEAGTSAPLGSASIRVTGTQIGAQSAPDGRYTIRGVKPGTVDLQITRIGYQAKHVNVTVTGGATVTTDFVLTQAPFSLAAVVTTVTGVQSKAEISNTVASIDVTSKIAETPITTTG
ncbi:MAG: carboxypeptidase-like regulatory domain-containing protein, partial [Deltaproteobacteria bacterium]